ncbi:MAG: PAS domain-containing protein [Bradymonadaceae bacterium]
MCRLRALNSTQRHAIRRELALTRRAVNAAEEGVVISEPRRDDKPIIFANEGFHELTGYSESEVIGRNCRFLQCEETSEETVAEIREAVAAQEGITVENGVRPRDHGRDGR